MFALMCYDGYFWIWSDNVSKTFGISTIIEFIAKVLSWIAIGLLLIANITKVISQIN